MMFVIGRTATEDDSALRGRYLGMDRMACRHSAGHPHCAARDGVAPRIQSDHSLSPFRAKDVIQNPYSIDNLPKLTRLLHPLADHQDKEIGHPQRPEFGKSTPWEPTVERLYLPHILLVKWLFNGLINKQFRVSITGQTFTRDALVVRYDDTSVFIHKGAIDALQEKRLDSRPAFW